MKAVKVCRANDGNVQSFGQALLCPELVRGLERSDEEGDQGEHGEIEGDRGKMKSKGRGSRAIGDTIGLRLGCKEPLSRRESIIRRERPRRDCQICNKGIARLRVRHRGLGAAKAWFGNRQAKAMEILSQILYPGGMYLFRARLDQIFNVSCVTMALLINLS